MKKLILLTSLLIFIACGKKDDSTAPLSPSFTVDPELVQYYQNFKADADKNKTAYGDPNLISISISPSASFFLTPVYALGVSICHVNKLFSLSESLSYTKNITIDPVFRLITSEDFKYKIFLNAIGQCAYHLSTSRESDSSAIMHSPIQISNTEDFEDLKRQFFDDAKANEANWNNSDYSKD